MIKREWTCWLHVWLFFSNVYVMCEDDRDIWQHPCVEGHLGQRCQDSVGQHRRPNTRLQHSKSEAYTEGKATLASIVFIIM